MSLMRYNAFNELQNDINRVFRAWNEFDSTGATAPGCRMPTCSSSTTVSKSPKQALPGRIQVAA